MNWRELIMHNQILALDKLTEKVSEEIEELDVYIKKLVEQNKELKKENKELKACKDAAVSCAWRYGQIDGGWHRLWVIDQMLRALYGDEAQRPHPIKASSYDDFVLQYEKDGFYDWETGIAP